jgi:DNA-binding XRE family transcriptional regulator
MIRRELMMRRKKRKMTRIELANLLGVCTSTVEKVEKGKRNASSTLAQKWSEILGINIRERWEIFFNNEQDNMSCSSGQQAAALQQTG